MYPVLFEIGGFQLRSWGLMVFLAVLAGTMLARRLAEKEGIKKELVTQFVLGAVLAGIIGARIWEVVFSWSHFAADPLSAFKFWAGGLSVQGAVAGGLLYSLWFVKKHSINFWSFADIAAPGLILGQAIGRIGCFMNGDAYGIPAATRFGVIYQPGTPAYARYGATPLVPAELMESAGSFLITGILLLLFFRFRPFKGHVALMYFVLYSLLRFALEFWRGDSLMVAGSLKAAQMSGLLMAATALAVMVFRYTRTGKAGNG